MVIQNFFKQFSLEMFKKFTVGAYTLWTTPNNSKAVTVW
jgi:hypothetical protein